MSREAETGFRRLRKAAVGSDDLFLRPVRVRRRNLLCRLTAL